MPGPNRSGLLLLGVLAAASCDSPSGPTPAGPPARLDVVSGDLQAATVGTQLSVPLVVKVADDNGKPVKGQVVNFRVTAGDGSVFAGTALTDKDGLAQEHWTLGTAARDTQKVEARAVEASTGATLLFGTFRAVGTPDAPVALLTLSGDGQTGALGAALADSIAAKVADRYGNGVAGQAVAFAVTAGAGSVTPAFRTTDSLGVARASWTLGARADSAAQSAAASSGSLPAVAFTAAGTVAGTLARVGGDAQAGAAGHFLPDSLAVQLRTFSGVPVRGATIQWTTAAGSVVPATSATDANGIARTSWLLPTVAGSDTAVARVQGAAAVGFGATAAPGPPRKVSKTGTTPASALVGTALADSVRVKVADEFGNGLANALVRWTASGGGAASPDSSRTDANGIAAARWTLGATPGTQTLTAMAGAASLAIPITATRPIAITVTSPAPGAVVTDTVRVAATITFQFAPLSVVATAAGRMAPLSLSGGTWRGALDLTGLPGGPLTLVVKASDHAGNLDSATVSVTRASPPTLTVALPADGAVVLTGTVRAAASCASPAGCRSIEVAVGDGDYADPPVLTGTGSVDGTVPFASPVDPAFVVFRATDSLGLGASQAQRVYVEPSTRLSPQYTAPGRVLDATPDSVLYVDTLSSPRAAKLYVRGTGATSVVTDLTGRSVRSGRLTSEGAVVDAYVTAAGADDQLYELRRGAAATLGAASSYTARGAYLLWLGAGMLMVRDEQAGTTTAVATGVTSADVSASGVVVYSAGGNLYRWQSGTTTPLGVAGVLPVTDGTLIVYQKVSTGSPPTRQLYWFDGAEHALGASMSANMGGPTYAVTSGWIAWADLGNTGQYELYVRSPAGAVQKVTNAPQSASIETLGPNGELAYLLGDGRRYVWAGGAAGSGVSVGSLWTGLARTTFFSGRLNLLFSNGVFSLAY
jgi:hypothetical protein